MPLEAHRLRHGQNQLVSLDRGHKGQCDAGVATCGLDQDGMARLDLARFLGFFDHRQSYAVFHARERVMALQLGYDGCMQTSGNTVQANQWCVANEFSNTSGNTRHDYLLVPGRLPRRALDELELTVELSVEESRTRIGAHAEHRSSHQGGC
jgi:hypothetical protein